MQPTGETGNRFARLDPHLMWTPERSDCIGCARLKKAVQEVRTFQQRAANPHVGFEESLCDSQGFRAAHHQQHPFVFNRDACFGGDFYPEVTGPARPAPGISRFLASDRDETEIADRSANGATVSFNDDDTSTQACRGVGMGQSNDTGPNDGQVIGTIE